MEKKKKLEQITLIGRSKIDLNEKQLSLLLGGSDGCACCICSPSVKGGAPHDAKPNG